MTDNILKQAVLALLRPLTRYLIARGWTYPVLCDLLKSVYVEAAIVTHPQESESLTDSRVSLLTGIHRKEVRRLREELDATIENVSLRAEASIAVRVVTLWTTSPRYLNSQRKPRRLPLRSTGRQLSFESLVKDTKADMRPNVILDELVRTGVVEIDKQDHVKLLRNAYVSALPEDKLAFLGANVGDHLRSALHNIEAHDNPYLERAVFYSHVDAKALAKLKPTLQQRSEQFLKEINNLIAAHSYLGDATKNKTDVRRMRLGVYYLEDESGSHAEKKNR